MGVSDLKTLADWRLTGGRWKNKTLQQVPADYLLWAIASQKLNQNDSWAIRRYVHALLTTHPALRQFKRNRKQRSPAKT